MDISSARLRGIVCGAVGTTARVRESAQMVKWEVKSGTFAVFG